jgi:uncharacterized protein YbjT (DUF2867 family)
MGEKKPSRCAFAFVALSSLVAVRATAGEAEGGEVNQRAKRSRTTMVAQSMEATILVTGGTGTLGRHVVDRLLLRGQTVRVLSRKPSANLVERVDHRVGDLQSGEGVASAVDGASVIVHCAGAGHGDERLAHNIVKAIGGGRPHVVFISVVGAGRVPVEGVLDRTMFGYFAMKREAELVIERSGLPFTTLRATQFHELLLLVMQKLVVLPVIPVPSGFSFQPIAADEVAARLVELALAAPAGLVDDVAGPEVLSAGAIARAHLHAEGRWRPVVSVPLVGAAARGVRNGANLARDHAVGVMTWDAFLSERHATLIVPRRRRQRAPS